MNKFFCLCAAAAIFLTAFAGCSENDDSKKEKSSSAVTETADEAETSEDSGEENSDTATTAKTEKETEASGKKSAETGEEAFIGKWEPVRLLSGEEDITDTMEVPLYAIGQLEVKPDGTAEMRSQIYDSYSEGDSTQTLIWTMDGNDKAVFRSDDENDDEEVTAYFEDGSLVFAADSDIISTVIYFTRVDEFSDFDASSYWDSFVDDDTSYEHPDISSGAEAQETIDGKWECSYYWSNGEEYAPEDLFGLELYSFFKLDISSSGTASLYTMLGSEDEATESFSWVENGENSYSFTDETGSYYDFEASIDGKELIFESEYEIMKFRKVTKFTETDWDKFYEDLYAAYDW